MNTKFFLQTWLNLYAIRRQVALISTPDFTSDAVALICRVPQGSVFGPKEDVENINETYHFKDHICTDETQLFAHMRLPEM